MIRLTLSRFDLLITSLLDSKIFEQVGYFQNRGGVKFIGGIQVVGLTKKSSFQVSGHDTSLDFVCLF